MSDLRELRLSAARQASTGNYWAGKALALIDQLAANRQALWDVYGILGFDQDGDITPDAIVGDLGGLLRDAATEFYGDYQEALGEAEGELQLAAQSIGAPDWPTARRLMAAYIAHPIPAQQAARIAELEEMLATELGFTVEDE